MKRISHKNHITAKEIPDELIDFIIHRFDQLAQETDVPPIIILVKPSDDITGPDYRFVSENGLLGEGDIQSDHYYRPYEWVSYWPGLKLYEILFLQNYDDGYWILISESIVDANPDLKWVLTDESQGGLSEPQPLY